MIRLRDMEQDKKLPTDHRQPFNITPITVLLAVSKLQPSVFGGWVGILLI